MGSQKSACQTVSYATIQLMKDATATHLDRQEVYFDLKQTKVLTARTDNLFLKKTF